MKALFYLVISSFLIFCSCENEKDFRNNIKNKSLLEILERMSWTGTVKDNILPGGGYWQKFVNIDTSGCILKLSILDHPGGTGKELEIANVIIDYTKIIKIDTPIYKKKYFKDFTSEWWEINIYSSSGAIQMDIGGSGYKTYDKFSFRHNFDQDYALQLTIEYLFEKIKDKITLCSREVPFVNKSNTEPSEISESLKIIGTWKGYQKLMEGDISFEFNDANKGKAYINNKYAYDFSYTVDYSKNPIWLDITNPKGTAKSIIKFIDNNTMLMRTKYANERPNEFIDDEFTTEFTKSIK